MNCRLKIATGALMTALLLTIGVAPGIAAQDICVSVNGAVVYQNGSANCASIEGSSAIAIGADSLAETNNSGEGNQAISIGDGSVAGTDNGSHNVSVAVGDFSDSESQDDDDEDIANNNTAIAVGDYSDVDISDEESALGGQHNVGIAVGEGSEADIDHGDRNNVINVGSGEADHDGGDDNSLIVISDDDFHFDEDVTGCFAIVVLGQVYGDEDCLD